MGFEHFPLEIWKEILMYAVAVRGLRRALRLQLVCKLFAAEVDEAVFRSGVLTKTCSIFCRTQSSRYIHRFYTPYVRRLALKWFPVDGGGSDFVCAVNEIADYLMSARGGAIPGKGRRDYVEALCELPPYAWFGTCLHALRNARRVYSDHTHEKNIFFAAIYLDILPVVRSMTDSLLDGSVRWEALRGGLFGNPINMAASHNKVKAFEIILDKVYASQNLSSLVTDLRKCSLPFAAPAGHVEIVDLVLSDRLAPVIIHKSALDFKYESRLWRPHYLDWALMTPSQAIFNKVFEYRQTTCLKGPIPTPVLERIALVLVKRDSKEMLAWLFNTHFCEFRDEFLTMAMRSACRGSSIDIVQLILEHAAAHQRRVAGIIAIAAQRGDVGLIKLLLDNENDINESLDGDFPVPPAIVSAVVLEHHRMFHFLLQRGALLDSPETVRMAVGRAKALGLTSMLEILEAEGIDISQWPPIFTLHGLDPSHFDNPRCTSCKELD